MGDEAFFGLHSTQVYAQFGWLLQIYRDAGVGSTEAGLLLATTASIGVVGSLIMPTVVDRSQRLWLWPVGFGVLSAIGYLGLLWWPADADRKSTRLNSSHVATSYAV